MANESADHPKDYRGRPVLPALTALAAVGAILALILLGRRGCVSSEADRDPLPPTPVAAEAGSAPPAHRPPGPWLGLIDSVGEFVACLDGAKPDLFEDQAQPLQEDAFGYSIIPLPPRGPQEGWQGPAPLSGTLPKAYEATMQFGWRGHSARVRPLWGRGEGRAAGRAVVYETGDLTVVRIPLYDRIEELVLVESPGPPPDLAYEIVMDPTPTEARWTEGGWVELWSGDQPVLRLNAIEAMDATGRKFQGRWEIQPQPEGYLARAIVDLDGAAYPVLIDPAWSSTASLATTRDGHTATLLPSGKVLVAGGHDGTALTSSCELYDPATGTWSGTGSMATARNGHTATLLPSGKVLVVAGGTLTSCELYDPAAGTWSATGSLTTGRGSHTATLLATGKVLVAAGHDGAAPTTTCELYDPTAGTWSSVGSMATGRYQHIATLLQNGKVLAAAGYNAGYPTGCELYDPAAGTWSATGSLPVGRYAPGAVLLPDGKVLIASGFATTTCHLYDPSAGTWSATGSLSNLRQLYTASLLPNGKVLAVGGDTGGGGNLATCQLYDPGAGTWSFTGSLATARYNHTGTLLPSGKVLVTGGTNGPSRISSCELYDPGAGSWAATGSLATGRDSVTTTLLASGKVLMAAGRINPFGGAVTATCELYDPAAGTWSSTGSMATGRAGATATLLPSGKVLAAGGSGLASCELYDPVAGTWSSTGSMAAARSSHTAVLLPSGKVLVAGGSGLASCELYDPAAGTWSATGSMTTARDNHTATLLASGDVLVAAGISSGTYLTSAELYNPTAGTWSSTGSMGTARRNHTATRLPSGRVLSAGGENSGGNLTSAELYDPGAGTWSATGSMATARAYSTSTLLPSGKVLATAGLGTGNAGLASCEIYDPAVGSWAAVGSLTTTRFIHTATLLPSGKVLAAGGEVTAGGAITTSCELYDDTGAQSGWRPSISTVAGSASFPVTANFGATVALTGIRFKGISEASGSMGWGNSSSNYPIVRLLGLTTGSHGSSGGSPPLSFAGSATGWTDATSLSVTLPTASNLPNAPYLLFVITNGIVGEGRILNLQSETPPTGLTVGQLGSPTPGFSAVHNDPQSEAANKRRIQVGPTAADVAAETNLLWNESASGVSFAPNLSSGTLSSSFVYGGSALSWTTTYSWRIKFWDTAGVEGPWSSVGSFTTASPSTALPNAGGWQMVAAPTGTAVSTSAVGGGFYWWNEVTRSYETPATLTPGYGYYWSGSGTMTLSGGTSTGNALAVGGLSSNGYGAPAGLESSSNQFRGWHMLGNPYNGSMSWDTIYDGSFTTNLESTYWKWDGTQYLSYNAFTDTGPATATIDKFQAFWVHVDPDGSTGSVTLQPPGVFGKPSGPGPFRDDWWLLQISAASGGLRDDYNWVGVHPAALQDRDPADSSDPGTLADPSVTLAFLPPGGGSSSSGLQQDVRPAPGTAGTEIVWAVRVTVSVTPMDVTLSWPNLGEIPPGWEFRLDATDLSSAPSLTYTQTATEQTFTLTAARLSSSGPAGGSSSPGSAPAARSSPDTAASDAPAGASSGGGRDGVVLPGCSASSAAAPTTGLLTALALLSVLAVRRRR